MEFKTSISKITQDDVVIRGEKLSNLMQSASFSDAAFLLLRKRKPSQAESKLFAVMLTSIVDHGMGTTSSLTSRFVMSGGNELNTAVGAGVLALGDYHGGAIENAMRQLKSVDNVEEFVKEKVENKRVIFGFGHKVYKEKDPRVGKLLELCNELNYQSNFITKAKEIESTLEKQKGRKIPLNVDGILAAILLEMGFPPEVGKGIFIIGRTPGLVAQALEEQEKEKPVRRVDESDIKYEE